MLRYRRADGAAVTGIASGRSTLDLISTVRPLAAEPEDAARDVDDVVGELAGGSVGGGPR